MVSLPKIRLLLVDDHAVVREALKALLSAEPSFDVVGQAQNGREAITLTNRLKPDLVVMDVAMPVMNGEIATREIVQSHPGVRVLALSSYSDDQSVTRMLQAGASGYISKQSAGNHLISAIQQIAQGEPFLGSLPIPLNQRQTGEKSPRQRERFGRKLSLRETEVLQLVAEGSTNREISNALSISIKTVEKHRQSLMEKLDLHDTASLTRYAASHGVIKIESAALTN
jgi:DNA-binding NarL/FixJ family response regulator